MGEKIQIGDRFGKLVVLKRVEDYIRPIDKKGRPKYLCKCDCGNKKEIVGSSLLSGTKSCGCLIGKNLIKHNDYKTRLYTIWKNMRQRCNTKNINNASYRYYAKRNILICKEWNDYNEFKNWAINNGYRNDLTIERIDVNGNYEPSNCRWATIIEQAQNKTNTAKIIYKGEEQTLINLSKKYNISVSTIRRRINLGWDLDRVFNEEVKVGKNQYYKK